MVANPLLQPQNSQQHRKHDRTHIYKQIFKLSQSQNENENENTNTNTNANDFSVFSKAKQLFTTEIEKGYY